MENSIMGVQITKLRKSAGLTQEDLGRAVGVSTQAVSRWENGGMPDVTLLPAIADRLGVSIDALFGRGGGESWDQDRLAQLWSSTVPRQQMISRLNRLVWDAGVKGVCKKLNIPEIQYQDSCFSQLQHGQEILLCSCFSSDDGIYFGVGAEDMAFSMVCPRPEKGYRAYFCSNENSRRFFSVLAQEGSLEVLEYLLSRTEQMFAARTICDAVGMEEKRILPLLEQMEQIQLMASFDAVLPDGETKIYQVRDDGAIVPLMYLVKAILEGGAYYLNWNDRSEPLL